MVRLWFWSQTDVPIIIIIIIIVIIVIIIIIIIIILIIIIIIIITYGPRLFLLKPESADRAVAGKDSSITFLAISSHPDFRNIC